LSRKTCTQSTKEDDPTIKKGCPLVEPSREGRMPHQVLGDSVTKV